MGLSCLRLLSHVSHDNAKFSDRIVFWSCNKSFVDQALLRYNCLLGSFYVGILYTLTSSWSIKTPKKSLSEYSAILMYTCHLCSHTSDNYALLVKAWKGIRRFRSLSSSPLPYTVFDLPYTDPWLSDIQMNWFVSWWVNSSVLIS